MHFTGNKHRCYTKKLELLDLNVTLFEETVDQIQRRLVRLWHKLEFDLEDEEPVGKNVAVRQGQLGLLLENV